ncbi:uncharacterized protein LOC105637944 isoform X2 [Jatropha curcas]|uniref:uncharacterized protein LOC105637944 isoform X2 n=1 Tax=Jatropha curcas TaxID=180498 RepID=UPI001893A047|nr:uncharacterized protein LOC105637944 isoform X2 [Jatropha curcas]
MDSKKSKISLTTTSSSSRRHSTRLLYDRRYGWVFDEWKDPSEEALAGGRGMFCILPLTKAFLNSASQSLMLYQSRPKTKTCNLVGSIFKEEILSMALTSYWTST